MSTTTIEREAASSDVRPTGLDMLVAMPVFAFLACSVAMLLMPTNQDHAWQFYLARQMLDGARLYVDVGPADMHPPLYTWMAMGMESIGGALGLSGLRVFVSFMIVAVVASIACVRRLGGRSAMLLPMLVLGLMAWPGYQFGQGDHVAVVWSLPYLTAAARSAGGKGLRRMPAVLVGVAAGVGMAMKPHFALLWIAVELFLAIRDGVASLWRTESAAILSVFVAYIAATALLTPEFFGLTWVPGLYSRFDPGTLFDYIVNPAVLFLLIAAVAVWRLPRDEQSKRLSGVYLLGALALYAAAVLQFKGWLYHWIPSGILSLAAIGAALPTRRWPVAAAVSVLAVALAVGAVRDARTEHAGPPFYQAETIPLVDRYVRDGSFLVLSDDPFVAFPLVTDRRIRWASPYMHLWMVPVHYADYWSGQPTRYRPLLERSPVERDMLDNIWRRVESDPPAIIMTRTIGRGFDLAYYFAVDPRFAQLFTLYVAAKPIGPYRVFVRSDLTSPG